MFDRLSIRHKLIAAFAALLCLTLILGAVALNRVGAVRTVAVDMQTRWMPSAYRLGLLNTAASDHRFAVALHVANTEAAAIPDLDARLARALQQVAAARAAYEPMIDTAEERQLYPEFMRLWGAYQREADAVVALSRRNENQAATTRMLAQMMPAYHAVRPVIDRLQQANVDGAATEEEDGNHAYRQTFAFVTGLLAAIVLLGAGLAWLIIRSIGKGIASVVTPMRAMAVGDLSAEVPKLPETTELGSIATALGAFHGALLAKRQADDALAVEARVKSARAERVEALIGGFEADSAEALRIVAAASVELDATAGAMQAAAHASTEQAASLAAASEQANANVQTVAASSEEMAASIGEVARQVAESARVAQQAAQDARATDAAVGRLSDSATRIGEVIRLISGIAGQTNLLALNATIEAARAGEHGKGFAVVASEVKALAQQTAKATEEIGAQIAAMQSATGEAVEAIRGIGRTIEGMDALTAQVAAATEEQAAATREIGRAVAEAATGTRDVSRHASGLTEGAQQTGAAAAQVRAASGELAQRAESLRGQVDGFLSGIRAA
ncbi:methyl-accepting chemotaxis protein [Humitalea rosea]|uniref:Methyl-accepting chemotaxis protein n=1 Tax=Humitalea rosea TaxID=990373 RepID=A0A2W7IRQ9_9PROT|nr:methyl-accepting chemotaxis protein [Humitalea rosea]PZW42127.1 methyl-accepting chemotaxis protein [Humitalea rosea]